MINKLIHVNRFVISIVFFFLTYFTSKSVILSSIDATSVPVARSCSLIVAVALLTRRNKPVDAGEIVSVKAFELPHLFKVLVSLIKLSLHLFHFLIFGVSLDLTTFLIK